MLLGAINGFSHLLLTQNDYHVSRGGWGSIKLFIQPLGRRHMMICLVIITEIGRLIIITKLIINAKRKSFPHTRNSLPFLSVLQLNEQKTTFISDLSANNCFLFCSFPCYTKKKFFIYSSNAPWGIAYKYFKILTTR